MNNYPLRNAGKPIFDPFANLPEQEVNVGFRPEDRRTYEVHRPCGHCGGTGRSKKSSATKTIHTDNGPAKLVTPNHSVASNADVSCSQCLLSRHVRGKQATDKGVVIVWGQTIEVFAFELTGAELNHLPPEKQLGAVYECSQHIESQKKARILCEQEELAAQGEVIFVVRHFA